MKIGDLVKYCGWSKSSSVSMPIAIVIDQRNPDSHFHHRIRVMWVGETIPIQASALSTTGSRITTWINPKHFTVINNK